MQGNTPKHTNMQANKPSSYIETNIHANKQACVVCVLEVLLDTHFFRRLPHTQMCENVRPLQQGYNTGQARSPAQQSATYATTPLQEDL